MRKQIGLRIKDETRDRLERVRGSLSRTDYIEGAVLAQIARDLKKTETPHEYSLDTGLPVYKVDMMEDGPGGPMYTWVCDLCGQPFNQWEECNSGIHVGSDGETKGKPIKSTILAALLRQSSIGQNVLQDDGADAMREEIASQYEAQKTLGHLPQIILRPGVVRSSAESKSGVLPVPKKAQKGCK